MISIHLPPLRERKEDIPLLARYFLERYAEKHGKPVKELSPEVLEAFRRYSWPGNVRELENTIERLVVFARRPVIGPEDLYFAGFEAEKLDLDLEEDLTLEEVEKRYILRVLRACEGNKTLAAQKLGIDRKTLREKLKRWGLA